MIVILKKKASKWHLLALSFGGVLTLSPQCSSRENLVCWGSTFSSWG